MDCSLPGSSIHGTCPARVLEWVAIAFSNVTRTHLGIVEIQVLFVAMRLVAITEAERVDKVVKG